MRLKFCGCAIGLLAIGWVVAGQAAAQEIATTPGDVDAIRSAIDSYVNAFNSQDVEKVVSHWSPEGVYLDKTTGEQTAGHEALKANLKETFAAENVPKLSLFTISLDLVSPNVALERGTATVAFSENEVIESSYIVIFTKRDGRWLIDRVTEESLIDEPTHFDELRDLEWMIGNWGFENGAVRVDLDCQWTTKQNFLYRKFKVFEGQEVVSSGLQIIGWDAKTEQIRSWLFDSDGGVVTGVWLKHDDGWTVQSTATLSEGEVGSFTTVLRPIDDDRCGWRKINQIVDGKLLPNVEEIVLERR
jgi:uncharacterized protein (TIGR02246 family)